MSVLRVEVLDVTATRSLVPTARAHGWSLGIVQAVPVMRLGCEVGRHALRWDCGNDPLPGSTVRRAVRQVCSGVAVAADANIQGFPGRPCVTTDDAVTTAFTAAAASMHMGVSRRGLQW
ncbi:hypothetical protein MRX96_029340 [Rhipicephalus microplus]